MINAENSNILHWFKKLDEWDIDYYLLRPINLNDKVENIDLIISKLDVKKLTVHLQSMNIDASISNSKGKNKVGILLSREILLTIKTKVCFFKSSFHSFRTPPPYSSFKVSKSGIVYPKVRDEQLFTFWILHLFLDNQHVSLCSSYSDFCVKFENSALENLRSTYCKNWIQKVFGKNHLEALFVLEQFCKNNFLISPELSKFTKDLILRRNIKTLAGYYLEKTKLGLLDLFRKELFKPISAFQT